MTFKSLIRFISSDGEIYFGDAILDTNPDARFAKRAYKVVGDVFNSPEVTDEVLDVAELLSPLDHTHVHTVRMIGMNYKKHAKEINLPLPEWPCLFYKPSSALNSPEGVIRVPKQAQIEGTKVDYESELVVVIGKEAKDVTPDEALNYVLGYTVGNDVSQRTWQIDRGGSQFSTGKMFDSWAPIGPAIVSSSVIKDPNTLNITSKVNGELRQNSNTDDAVFYVKDLVSFLSMGTTLKPGDLIFTGTPHGVGSGFRPPKWLTNHDVVECYIDNIGSISNKISYDK